MGTVGNGLYGNLDKSINTTGSAVEIQRQLKLHYNKGVVFTSMEVSSHSLCQYRVKSLRFKTAIFTNLTLDHLDYHNNMYNYEISKWKLFSKFNINNCVINIDDPVGYKWSKRIPNKYVIAVSMNKQNLNIFYNRWICIRKIKNYGFLKKIYFNSSKGSGILKTSLIGNYNVMNLLLSFITLIDLGYKMKYLLNTSQYLNLPLGRMDIINFPKKPLVIIDYAHTPDAFKNILIEVKKICINKLWCVFGCTGNRDKSKRSLMGKISKDLADIVVITNDDPYGENENNIINDIKIGIKDFNNVYIILNRDDAINFCVQNSSLDDILLILGKGHEEYQFFLNKKKEFSDKKFVVELLERS